MSNLDSVIKDIPVLDDDVIERKSIALFDKYSSSNSVKLEAPIDVMSILEYLGYDIDFRHDGIYADKDILGGLIISDKKVEINEYLTKQEGRMNFTLAHEVGHIDLHVPLYQKENKIENQNKDSDILCRKDAGLYGDKKKSD